MTNEEMIKLACSELTKLSSALLKQSMESMMQIIMNPKSEKNQSNIDEDFTDNYDSESYDDSYKTAEKERYSNYDYGEYYLDTYDESPFLSEDAAKPNTNADVNSKDATVDNEERNASIAEDSQDNIPIIKLIKYNTPLDQLELSVRAYSCLRRSGIDKVGQLFEMSFDDLCNVRNLGRKSLEEVVKKMNEVRDEYLKSKESNRSDKETQSTFTSENALSKKSSNNIYLEKLNELIGLDEVKEQVKKINAFVRMKQDMPKECSVPMVLNMEFVGNPGTAKTTVARIMAGLLYEAGLLQSSEIVEVGRAGLVGKYTGHTAAMVESVFDRADGKLLFIDEAYSLADNDEGGFGDEAITTIVQEMENFRDRTVVVFAGYPDKMEEFFDKNPGLRSRVPFKITFKDYTPDELYKISEIEAKRRGFTISSEAIDKLLSIYGETIEDPHLGNGRYCRNMVESAILNYAYRNYGENNGTQPTDSSGKTQPDYILKAVDFERIRNIEYKTATAPIGFRG